MTFPIAHRGLATRHAENSRAAIDAALVYCDVVEIDVRATSDNVPVCTHDVSLLRAYGVDMRVSQLTAAALRQSAPQVATLAEALDTVHAAGGAVMLDVKVSRPAVIEAIIDVVDASPIDWYTGRGVRHGEPLPAGTASFQSSDPQLLRSFRSRTGAACLELVHGHSSLRSLLLTAPFITAYAHGVTVPDALAKRLTVATLKRLGLGVYVYTVNDPDRYRQLAERGVAGVYTDRVDHITG
ncbi:MAG: putative glycerophosphoryl diester phosphodiesterase [Thermoleophilia bacterium]|nr:putative glycerophosphoryl diester phosphodiesterase [Thermoleophilia bacterium]